MQQDFERAVTVTVRAETGFEVTCSAIMERDPNFLHWNRMSLLGNQETMLSAMRLSGKGPVQWKLLHREMRGHEGYV